MSLQPASTRFDTTRLLRPTQNRSSIVVSLANFSVDCTSVSHFVAGTGGHQKYMCV